MPRGDPDDRLHLKRMQPEEHGRKESGANTWWKQIYKNKNAQWVEAMEQDTDKVIPEGVGAE